MIQPPKIGLDQFWQLVRESRLVPATELDRLVKESTALNHEDSEALASWLVGEKVLTKLQSEVLQAGHAGPFEFGRYRILGVAAGDNVWVARDRKTLFPVWLHFYAGESQDDLARWDEIEKQVEHFKSINHPNLISIYEAVVTRSHRFVATATGGSQTLAEKMPIKRRLTEEQALKLVREVALPIAEIENNDLAHGALSLESIFHNAKAGTTKVLPPLFENASEPDVKALGQLTFRLLTGRDAPESKKIAKAGLKKFADTLSARKVRPEVGKLIFEALTDNDSLSANDFLKHVEKLSGEAYEANSGQLTAREAKFISALSPWHSETQGLVTDEVIPDVEGDDRERATATPTAKPKKKRVSVAVSIALSLFGFAACLGIVALAANLVKLDPPKKTIAKSDSEPIPETDPSLDAATAAKSKREQLAELLRTQSYVQDLVDDDQQSLWESPTTGFPIDVSSVPPSPRLLAAVNWQSVYASDYGKRTLQALGPNLSGQLKQLEAMVGFPLDSISSSIISLHSNESFEYEVCATVSFANPESVDTCLQNWGQPSAVPGLDDVYEKKTGTSWWIANKSPEDSVTKFVVGPSVLVQQAAQGEVAVLSGTLRNLVDGSDAKRDVSLLFPTISLFNTEGQKLFSGRQKWLNELRFVLPNSVRGMNVSFHHDNGDYVELRLDHTSELSSRETANTMRMRTTEKLEELQLSMQQRQALPYWESLRFRYGAMIRELTDQLRWDSEFESVIGNAWLPPGALHNLFAASELAMTFEPVKAVVADANQPKTPQTLEELLASRRDLTIANPPDLNVLLKNIREEVSDQYLEMPFEFNIEIAGTDLQKEGITQNQRPGPLRINDRSLADILTQVMVSANPNRDISGASDPNCKLVWVVIEDPESKKKSVLITTRAAAVENGFELPAAFVTQE